MKTKINHTIGAFLGMALLGLPGAFGQDEKPRSGDAKLDLWIEDGGVHEHVEESKKGKKRYLHDTRTGELRELENGDRAKPMIEELRRQLRGHNADRMKNRLEGHSVFATKITQGLR